MWAGVPEFFSNVWNYMIKPWFADLGEKVANILGFDTWKDMKKGLTEMFAGIPEFFSNTWDYQIKPWFAEMGEKIANILGFETVKDLKDAGLNMIQGLWDGIKEKWGSMKDWFGSKLQGLRDMLPFSEPKDSSSPLRGLKQAGTSIWGNIMGGLKEKAMALSRC